jgi:polysaccharide export outer membrane protein
MNSIKPEIAAFVLALLVACVGSVACAGGAPGRLSSVGAAPPVAAGVSTEPLSDDPAAATRLGAGDTLRVTVDGEKALSGEYEVDDAGTVTLPLVGEIRAGDTTLRSFVEEVAARLRHGHVEDPQVRAELVSYRPFYIIFCGAEKGGQYPFVSGIPATAAASLIGGSTIQTSASDISIIRRGNQRVLSATPDIQVQPGDVMLVACDGRADEPTTVASAVSRPEVVPIDPEPMDQALLPPVSAVTPTPPRAAPAAEKPTEADPSDAALASPDSASASAYRLGSGDKLRVIVFGEEDLSGEFEVDGSGNVSLPLIGQVSARNRTLRSFEKAVAEQLRDGYLRDPRVSAEVLNYRPFYIIGEVEEGGEYPFVSGMHVLNAVALAGGHTYRANPNRVFITRRGQEREFSAPLDSEVQPGDVIRVPERFF